MTPFRSDRDRYSLRSCSSKTSSCWLRSFRCSASVMCFNQVKLGTLPVTLPPRRSEPRFPKGTGEQLLRLLDASRHERTVGERTSAESIHLRYLVDSEEVVQESDDVLPHEVVHDDGDWQKQEAPEVRQSHGLEGVETVTIESDDPKEASQRQAQRD